MIKNKFNKSIALSLAIIAISTPVLNSVFALENTQQVQDVQVEQKSKEIEESMNSIEVIKITNNKVQFKIDNKNYEYDADNEILSSNGKELVQFETVVDYINPESGLTEEEYLAIDKENILNNFRTIEIQQKNPSQRSMAVDYIVPSNAAYTIDASFSKNINTLYGELGDSLGKISTLTSALTLCGSIEFKALMGSVSTATGLTSAAINATKGSVGGKWSYTLHKTKNKYVINVPNYSQHAYRYAQKGVSLTVKIGSKTYTPYTQQTNRGKWFI
ncbi:MAG: hypothetical protein ACRC92_16780 [Peptostreptococcaceae bacterium]